jgi:hypothetical protein
VLHFFIITLPLFTENGWLKIPKTKDSTTRRNRAILQTTNPPRRSTSRNAILHLTSPPQARNRPWKPPPQKTNKYKTSSNWVQNHSDKIRRNVEKIQRNRHLLLQLSIYATFFAITNPQRSSSKQSAKPTLLRKRRKRANEERGRRTGGRAQALVDSKGLHQRSPRGDWTLARGFVH